MAEQPQQNSIPEPENYYVGREFGRAGQDILNKYGGWGENPDKVIATKGMSYIKDIERDTHLASALSTRRAKLIRKGWRIVPASQKLKDVQIARFVQKQLIDMQGAFEKDLEGMLDAVGKGFSLTEINYRWVSWNGQFKVGLKNLRYKDPEWFSFKYDELGYFRINQIDPDPNGVELPGDKFIHIITGQDDENPYGRSVDAEVAFWVWIKKNVAKFWAIFAEKFGMPLSQVTVPRNASDADLATIDDIMDAIQEETGIRVPEGFDVKFLEAMRSAEVGYEKFIDMCNKEISKRVFGATLVSEEGKRGQGSYALGSEHADIFEEYVTFDAAILEAAISEQLIRPLVLFNWDVEDFPRFEFIEFAVGIFISFSQAVMNLVNSGMKIPVAWAHERLRIPMPAPGEEVLQPVRSAMPGTGADDGQDGNAPDDIKKPDNKIKMADTVGWGRLFEEVKKEILGDGKEIFDDIDRLTLRYQNLMAEKYEELAQRLKKKSMLGSESSCRH